MGLSRYKVAAGVAVSDMGRARDLYEEKLGLSVGIDSGDNVQYRCGEGTMFHVYLSPEHAGNSTAILACLRSRPECMRPPIHPSAWKEDSANFGRRGFSDVRQ